MTRRRRRILLISASAAVALVVVAGIAIVSVLRSDWFREQVRTRIVAETEKATGGRVEIRNFRLDWRTLHARVEPFVLHGKEKPGEPPFVELASIDVGLKVVSILKKDVDISTVIVDQPRVRIQVYPDGTTNIPSPRIRRSGRPFDEQVLRLAIGHFELRNGTIDVRDERLPFDVRGDNLQVAFDYDANGPRYRGRVSSRRLHLEGAHFRNAAFDFDSGLAFEKNRLVVSDAVFVMPRTRATANGSLHDWSALAGEFDFEAQTTVSELARMVTVPVEHRGEVSAKGKAVLSWPGGFKLAIDGAATGRNLAYRDQRVRVDGISLRTDFHLTRTALSLPNLRASALNGDFNGRVDFRDDFNRIEVEGNARDLSLDQIMRVSSEPNLAWSGIASGPVRIDGVIGGGRPRNFTVQMTMDIRRAPGAIPIEGYVDLVYDQRAGSLRLANSRISTDATQISASGTLGQTLRASLRTSDLNDVLPGLAMFDSNAPRQLPLKLLSGVASADAVVSGPLSDPSLTGKVTLGAFEFEGRKFDRASGNIAISRAELTGRNLEIARNGARITGSGRADLTNWKIADASRISAEVSLSGGDLKRALADAGRDLPVTGTLLARAEIGGTVAKPEASVEATIDHPTAWGEPFDQLRARVRWTGDLIEITHGTLRAGGTDLAFRGSYRRTGPEWTTGAARFEAAGDGFHLDQFQAARNREIDLNGRLGLKAVGTARVVNSEFDLETLDSQLTIAGVTFGAAPIGNLMLTARTRGDILDAQLSGAVQGSKVTGAGEWRLTDDYPGRAQVTFTPLSFAALHVMAARGKVGEELPFAGSVEGQAVISGPLKKPDALRADVVLSKVEMTQNPSQPLRQSTARQDLTLRNTAPVQFSATTKAVTIQSARFAGADTSLDAVGRVTFDSKSPWDVAVRGRVNLVILKLFNPDLLAQGSATVDTTIRGALADPQMTGKLELKNASLYLRDLPQGVDNANGLVTFDRNRANIEKLTAEIGGGRVAFGGFIGFSSGLLLYRVQANAEQIRIRHPDGASLSFNAVLNLTGTSENGLVSGSITVLRAGFEPRTDVASLLAQSTKPLPAPSAPNEYLRGLTFDVRIESGPSLELQTSLTRDLQADAELRLRGNAARPVLLGDVSFSQGEVQFFGNKYIINRGQVRFINPTKVEPVFDIDLETKARGITVTISLAGTLNKLNLTYRSDPPLQTNDIIALLAVGRDPTTSAFANAQTRSNLLQSGASTLGQAVAAPVSSRLQRFFGVSRLKIDPQLTGVENIPQARLTLEQQVSRDVTLTYITNLTRTQEQIVRIQWDINRQWSAIAVREENGVFGIDFQYRKRFK